MTSLTIRPAAPGDLPLLLKLNNAAVPAVNELDIVALERLIAGSLTCLVALENDQPVGFLLCIADGSDYESPNYAWLSERVNNFAYTDRICVDEKMRGRKIGDHLYNSLFAHPACDGRSFVCEVNERPPNPGSLRFHQRLGFSVIGSKDHGDKAVVFLRRDPGTSVAAES
ncbi:hypothetical protein JM93_02885 [Roseibium hamelinense]|uniref:N-acetyltransferase domain-containing protein n=1 Tax=Roseibium hamelinense TaxID=150831 RepID=A0A562SXU4_9HYPH|nr:GNAT family N-acetyltransferase [Roseibium hamelinense]MTI43659.1 GNAT family N-acetyltransferase [Roseibium hamelinense]TWI86177.1 hypothetical protein JM93_02885 [Roseibium hamelinense]